MTTQRVGYGRAVRGVGLAIAALLLAASGQPARAQGPSGPPPRVWAIVVGVGRHDNPLVPATPGAAAAAAKVRDWITGPAGWPRANVLFLSDFGSRDPGNVDAPARNILPTRANLDWAFGRWLESRVRPTDLVVIFHAGRTAAANPEIAEDGVDYHLLPFDADPARLASTGWVLDHALDALIRRLGGRMQVVVWLASAPRPLGPRGASPTPDGRDWLRRLTRWSGVGAWLADGPSPDGAEGTPAPVDDVAGRFAAGLIRAAGTRERPASLAEMLARVRLDPALRPAVVDVAGGLPAELTAWQARLTAPGARPRPEVVPQLGHADEVTALVITPDDRLALSASRDATIRVWSARPPALLRVLSGSMVGVSALALAADGNRVIAGSLRSEVLVYDLGREPASRPILRQPHRRPIRQVVTLPDGVHAISLDLDGIAYSWDLSARALEPVAWPENPGPGSRCRSLAVGGDAETGRLVAWMVDGSVLVAGPDGTGAREAVRRWADVFPPEAPTISAVALDPEGRSLLAGTDDGRLATIDLASGRVVGRHRLAEAAVRRLVATRTGRLVVATDDGLWWLPQIREPRVADPIRLLDGPVVDLDISPDGRRLAACHGPAGAVMAWSLDEPAGPRPFFNDPAASAAVVRFRNDARALVVGRLDGGLRTPWVAAPDVARWAGPPRPGKIRHLAVSRERGAVLAMDDRGGAMHWDPGGRTCRRLPGRWSAGAFLDEGRAILSSALDAAREPGRLAVFDLGTMSPVPRSFARSAPGFALPEEIAFEAIAVSPDGTLVAAAAAAGAVRQPPYLALWETATGRLLRWATPPEIGMPVTALSFSDDGRVLVAAGAAGPRLWVLDRNVVGETLGTPRGASEATEGRDPAGVVTAAAIRPAAAAREADAPIEVVTGHRAGQLVHWSFPRRDPAARPARTPLLRSEFRGAVHAVWFDTDGQTLAAAGDAKEIWLGRLGPGTRLTRDRAFTDALRPHHLEQINALAALPARPGAAGAPPAGPLLVSASDDASLRFWDLSARALRATWIPAAPPDRPAPPDPARPAPALALDWLVYTPDGQFDATPQGREVARYRDGDRVERLEQLDEATYSFGLAERLLRRQTPSVVGTTPEGPPPLALEPPARHEPGRRTARLTVRLGAPGLRDVRLYHNGVPVPIRQPGRGDDPERDEAEPGARLAEAARFAVEVQLARGLNRFYAMASRDGAYDARSSDVELQYDGPLEPGKLHVVALGVGDYARRQLRYPGRDAEAMVRALGDRALIAAGAGGGQAAPSGVGERIVLVDAEVEPQAIDAAFRRVARAVRGRPQDTVAVFLAGHAGVFDDRRFCLLLSPFPFAPDEPLFAAARQAPPIGAGVDPAAINDRVALPFATIARQLNRLDALHRLVIIDACQAEAIRSDPEVEAVRKWAEIGTRRARTSYLIATRRGEPAFEAYPLGHGLFTYVLLRGMRAVDLRQEPVELGRLSLPDDADSDGDGMLTTGELEAYARVALPPVASAFPDLVAARAAVTTTTNVPALDQNVAIQSGVNADFPLIALPGRGGRR